MWCTLCDSYAPGNLSGAAIVQVASGRWMGESPLKYLTEAEEIDIKVAQGVKPGDGGHLPANKVGSRVRHKKKLTYAMHLILPVLHCTPTTSSLTTPHPPTHALPRHASLRGTAHLDAALHTLHDTTGH